MRAFLLAAEEARLHLELSDWSVAVEASHWSGTLNGSMPELLVDFPTPMFDIEIGSCPSSWTDPRAAHALAMALLRAPHWKSPIVHSLLCVGGVHFESSFRDVIFAVREPVYAVSHILPTRWIQDDGYRGGMAIARMRRCAGSILGGIHAVVYHDSLKSDQKGWLREFATELSVPCVKHRHLRNGGF
jgi:D-tyrosyl-tRNA(Tyr) deacylase